MKFTLLVFILLGGSSFARNIDTATFETMVLTDEGRWKIVQALCPSNNMPELVADSNGHFETPSDTVKFLSKGAWGNVLRYDSPSDGSYLVKEFRKEDSENFEYILREINIGFKVKTSMEKKSADNLEYLTYITECISMQVGGQLVLYTFSPYFEQGDLTSFIKKNRYNGFIIPFSWKLQVIIKILKGLSVLHDNGYIHRDLKPQNIIMRTNDDPTIIDFGFTKKIDEARTLAGTPRYIAPEVLLGTYTNKADIYSLGLVFFEILNAASYNSNKDQANFVPVYCKENRFQVNNSVENWEQTQFCNIFFEVITAMIEKKPENRPSTSKLIDVFESYTSIAEKVDSEYFSFIKTIPYFDFLTFQNNMPQSAQIFDGLIKLLLNSNAVRII